MKKKQPKRKPKATKKPRRQDHKVNDELIAAKFSELLLKNQKMPSYEDVAAAMGVSAKTVSRHIKDMDFDARFKKFRAVSDKVMMNLFKQSATGKNHAMMRLWFELVEGLGEKKKIEISEVKAPVIIIPGDGNS